MISAVCTLANLMTNNFLGTRGKTQLAATLPDEPRLTTLLIFTVKATQPQLRDDDGLISTAQKIE